MPKVLNLDRRDSDDLADSGINAATMERFNVYTERDPSQVAALLNWADHSRHNGPALVFPYHTLEGSPNGFVAVKPHKPRTNDNGKSIKYEHTAHKGLQLYWPVGEPLDRLLESSDPIYITEGYKKAMLLCQCGYACIGLSGVYCWKQKGSDALLPGFDDIPLANRDLYIVFDQDAKPETQTNVYAAAYRLAAALFARSVRRVYIVSLPANGDEKVGVDDYIVTHSPQEFADLVASTQPLDAYHVCSPSLIPSEGRTQIANGVRFAAHCREHLRYCATWLKWLHWDGTRWQMDELNKHRTLSKHVALRVQADAKQAIEQVDQLFPKMEEKERDALKKAISTFSKSTTSTTGVSAMREFGTTEPGMSIHHEHLDKHPYLFNVRNGTIDLRTGKLQSPNPQDFLTQRAAVEFKPDARCPTWHKFLREIFCGHDELISFVQRLCGYALTGDIKEHILPIFWGDGRNGKSTLIEVVLYVLGEYGLKANKDLITQKYTDSHPTDIAQLFGKRVVAVVETGEDRQLDETLIKELTGGDRRNARRMREDFWQYDPTDTFFLGTNHKPKISGTDLGIWRRLKLIPFEYTVPEDKQDSGLKDKLKRQAPGIFNWLIQGCLDWYANGLQPPEIVEAATQEYARECDQVGAFIAEACIPNPNALTTVSDLYSAYKKFTNDRQKTANKFGRELTELGYEKVTQNNVRYRRGLKIREEWRPKNYVLNDPIPPEIQEQARKCVESGNFPKSKKEKK